MNLLLVMAGGAIGSGARFLIGRALPAPGGTLAVNLLGGLLMGLLAGVLAAGRAGEAWRLLLGVGLLGGFTTFSAFSLDAVALWEQGRAGAALGYAFLSVAGSVAALAMGLRIARAMA